MKHLDGDIVVIGGGLGGVAAALAAAEMGCSVIMTEETPWIGGQLTAQAVPPDENRWIETSGCTGSYRRLRQRIRDYYARAYPLSDQARRNPQLNPGNGTVSRLCHEPSVARAVLHELLAPHVASGRLQLLRSHTPVKADVDGDRIAAVVLRSSHTGEDVAVAGRYVIDATELGSLAELAGVEHVCGAESAADTGEMHAIDGPAQPLDQQAISVCFALEHRSGESHVIDRPAEYAFWSSYQADFWPDRQLSWTTSHPQTLEPLHRPIFDGPEGDQGRQRSDLWHYRRILDAANFDSAAGIRDVTLVNWPQTDYWLGPLIGVPPEEADAHVARARQLSLSLLYWMQTEAPRYDGGTGYPGLRLRGDLVGDTPDGLAIYPYVRESRRIVAETCIVEEHCGVEARGSTSGAEEYKDSVGIGHYRIDLHPSTGGPSQGPRNYIDVDTLPFQVPLGALIPARMENYLPACKNIGTTHITNGCYRLHPVEWNIGEVSGSLAAHCVQTGMMPRQVRNTPAQLSAFQQFLAGARHVELSWPDEVTGSEVR